MEKFDVVVLAAGLGTRMNSDLAKVLHEIDGKPMLYYVLNTLTAIKPERIILVVGHQAKKVIKTTNEFGIQNILYVNQKEQLGTAHAVMTGLEVYEIIDNQPEFILVIYGDVPLVKTKTLNKLVNVHQNKKPVITMLTTSVEDPTDYGRIIRDNDDFIINIVEENEANSEQKKIRQINPGFYCFETNFLRENIRSLSNDNQKGEFYLTDMIPYAAKMGKKIVGVDVQNFKEVMGINTLEELKIAEKYVSGC